MGTRVVHHGVIQQGGSDRVVIHPNYDQMSGQHVKVEMHGEVMQIEQVHGPGVVLHEGGHNAGLTGSNARVQIHDGPPLDPRTLAPAGAAIGQPGQTYDAPGGKITIHAPKPALPAAVDPPTVGTVDTTGEEVAKTEPPVGGEAGGEEP